jgi:hypothetical protein
MILGPNGKPMNLHPDLPEKTPVSAEVLFDSKKKLVDTYYDKTFVRHLVKQFQKVEPQIGAQWYPHIQCVVFWYNGVIVYKVMLTEYNVDEVSIKSHIEKVTLAIQMLKTDKNLYSRLRDLAQKSNKKYGVNI